MATSAASRRNPSKKIVLFRGADAPTLEETGMMAEMTYTVEGADSDPISADEVEVMQNAGRLTVPYFDAAEHGDSERAQGGLSLVEIEFAPGYLLPKHSHSSDCLYYIIRGGIRMGKRELGPGDGFFLPAEQVYTYQAGAEGVTLLEFRDRSAFDMKVHEQDMTEYRRKAIVSLTGSEDR